VAGAATDQVAAGLAMSTGALNVAFRDSIAPYSQRAKLMLAASVVAGVAVYAGGMSGRNAVAAVLVAGMWAFGAGMLVAFSAAAADLGVMSVVMLLVYSSTQRAIDHAVLAGLLAIAGGLVQTALALVFWPLRRYAPERRALGELYLALEKAAESRIEASQSPPASAQSTAAQTALASLDRDDSLEGARYRALLSQAERMRLSLLALSRLRNRMERENPSSPALRILEHYFASFSRALASIAAALLPSEPAVEPTGLNAELVALAEQLRSTDTSPFIKDARFQMDGLTGQLRSAADLAVSATPAGAEAFAHREAAKPWRLRLGGRLATLRANFSLSSAAFRHAIRLAVCVAIGDAVARSIELNRAYWLPMTIAILLRPDFTATFSRGLLRLAGTFVGLIFATALFHVLPVDAYAQVAALAVLMFLLRCFGPANYGILAAAVSAVVVMLVAMSGVSPREVIAARAWNTLAGGAIALLAYWLWPTWESTQFAELLARALVSYRRYFHAVSEWYLNGVPNADEVDRLRVAGRLARANLEASIERLRAEPGVSADRTSLLGAILASSLRLAHALMAIEAGLYSANPPALPQEAFREFAKDLELTLDRLAAALSGSPAVLDSVPDLREDHRALVQSGDPAALISVETDRITNSVDTLREEVAQWITNQRKLPESAR